MANQSIFELVHHAARPVPVARTPLDCTPQSEVCHDVASETDRYSCRLLNPDPGLEYVVQVGNSALPSGRLTRHILESHFVIEPARSTLGLSVLEWPTSIDPDDSGSLYFESCIDEIPLILWSRPLGGTAEWTARAHVFCHINPSKISRDAYDCMRVDVHEVAAGLLLDTIGRGGGYMAFGHGGTGVVEGNALAELSRLEQYWPPIAAAVAAISRRGGFTTLHRERRLLRVNSIDQVDHRMSSLLAARGISAEYLLAGGHATVPAAVVTSTVDTSEHRVMRTVLRLLAGHALSCVEIARTELAEASAVARRFRKEPRPRRRYELLADCLRRAESIRGQIQAVLTSSPHWEGASANRLVFSDVFRYSPYKEFRVAAASYLNHAYWTLESGPSLRAKHTSRLYEQWAFLKLVEGFRRVCISPPSINENVLRRGVGGRYVVDLVEDEEIRMQVSPTRYVGLQYEARIPAIHRDNPEQLYYPLGNPGHFPAKTPDIVLRRYDGGRLTNYCILDAKYAKFRYAWDLANRITRTDYDKITTTNRVGSREVWLIHPAVGPPDQINAGHGVDQFWHLPMMPGNDELSFAVDQFVQHFLE